MTTFAQRRHNAEDFIDMAIQCLSKKDKQEKQMIKDLENIKQRIDNTIIYYIK